MLRFWGLLLLILLTTCWASEVRTYRQTKDVATQQTGKVQTSQYKGDLFETTYLIDEQQGLIKRTALRRLDQTNSSSDGTEYTILYKKYILGSKAGEGGQAIVAIQKNGGEIIALGDSFAFTSRTSDFSQMITGVYERVN